MANVKAFKERLKKARDEAGEKGQKGTFISEAGRFRVEILSSDKIMCLDKEKLKRGIQDRNQPAFVCEFRILESDNAKYPVGSTGSWFVKDPEGQNLSDVERLMWAAQGYEPKTVRTFKNADSKKYEAYRDAACGWAFAAMNDAEALECLGFDSGFLAGLEVLLETRMTTMKNGGDFTVYDWSPTPETAESPIEVEVEAA